ncbi:hypothetical protein RSAG8_04286, partial [Rhizoctonia solani AG-8 WAC10335]
MAAANHPVAQPPTPNEAIAGPAPPVVPDHAPAPQVAMQLPANAPQGALPHPPQNGVAHNHQAVQVVAQPAIPIAPFLALGTSPLHRSLYGRPLGN